MSTSNRIRLTLHYNGAAFHGWQVQPDVRTVQEELDAALSRLADRAVVSHAAGRTDTGVHATGQVAHADLPAKWTAAALRTSLNAILPPEIWVASAAAVSGDFHARYSATARGYIYRIGTMESARSPFRSGLCWALTAPLDRGALESGAAAILGEHSFRGFAKAGQPERGYVCEVKVARWAEWAGGVELRIVANRFLHHMVRYLVGTMVDAARGRRPLEDVAGLLDEARLEPEEARSEGAADGLLETSPPAPPEGLFLAHVYYDEQPNPEGPENEDLP